MPRFYKKQLIVLNLILAFCLFFPSIITFAEKKTVRVRINLYEEFDGKDVRDALVDAGVILWRIGDKEDYTTDEKIKIVDSNKSISDKEIGKEFSFIREIKAKDGVVEITLENGSYYVRVKNAKNGLFINDFVFNVSEFLEEDGKGEIVINPKHTQPRKPHTPPDTPPPETPPDTPPDTPPETPPDVPPETPPDTPPEPPKYKKFRKVSTDGPPIEGVVFRLTKEVDGKQQNLMIDGKIFTVSSGKDGYFEINLYNGKYEIWETKQAPGYEQLTSSVKFEVKDGDEDLVLVIKNRPFKIHPLPKTGDLVFPMLLAVGVIIFVMGFVISKSTEKKIEL